MRTLVYLCLATALFFRCGSDESTSPSSSFSNTADAAASEDAKSGGIYKGAIVGSSGNFAVVLQKGQLKIVVKLDGVSKTLTTAGLSSWTSGEPIKNVLFEADDWQAIFSVGASGNMPSIAFSIPGHADLKVVIVKELSTDVVRVFEGTYTGTSSGTWNFIIQGPALTGVSRSADGSTSVTFYGLVNGNTLSLDVVSGTGTISGDNVSGTWEDSGNGSGTWTGKRVM